MNIGNGYLDRFYVRNLTNRPITIGDLLNVMIPAKKNIDLLGITGMTKEKINMSKDLQSAVSGGFVSVSKENQTLRIQSERQAILASADVTELVEEDIDDLTVLAKHMEPTTIDTNVLVVGSTSDYTTVGSALSDATSGQLVLIMPGTYYVTSTLTVPSGVNISGWSRDDVYISGTVNGTLLSLGGTNCVSNIRIGNTSTNSSSSTIGSSSTATDLNIFNCRISDSSYVALNCTSSSSAIWNIQDIYFDSLMIGAIKFEGTTITIRDCLVVATISTAILTEEYDESSFFNFVSGTAYLLGNAVTMTRSSGIGRISYVSGRDGSDVTKNLYSIGNHATIAGNNATAYGFSAGGLVNDPLGDYYDFYSCGDHIIVSSNEASGQLGGNGLGNNTWTCYAGTPNAAAESGDFGGSTRTYHYAFT